jgi:hypothetical protein
VRALYAVHKLAPHFTAWHTGLGSSSLWAQQYSNTTTNVSIRTASGQQHDTLAVEPGSGTIVYLHNSIARAGNQTSSNNCRRLLYSTVEFAEFMHEYSAFMTFVVVLHT